MLAMVMPAIRECAGPSPICCLARIRRVFTRNSASRDKRRAARHLP
jgi:hypothetical protein